MPRILPTGFLLLTAATAAQAQTSTAIDTLTSRRSAVAMPVLDSLPDRLHATSLRIYCGLSIIRTYSPLPTFTTIQPALSRIAGVQVTPYSGAPGAWSTVRIRGVANLTGSSQPLYVVDGVPVYNTNLTPENWTGYRYSPEPFSSAEIPTTPFSVVGNPLLDIPVEDIDQVEIVQGAAATAAYGAQGTNGVINISTRRGADGAATAQAPRVRYAGWGGVQLVRQHYELLSARQYAELVNVAAANNNRTVPPYSASDLSQLQEVDWQDKAFRVAAIQSHNLSLNGLTNQHTRYYVAADYLRQSGVVRNSDLSRYSLRANVEQQIGRKLMVVVRASGSQLDQHQPGFEPDAGPLLRGILLASPAEPFRNAGGNITPTPLRALNEAGRTPRTRRLLTQVHATYQFTPALALRVFGSRERVAATDKYALDVTEPNGARSLRQDTAKAQLRNWVVGAELRYQRTLRERHAFTASVSYLRQQFRQDTYQSSYRQLSFPNQGFSFSRSTYTTEFKILPTHSPAAALAYVYDGRYELHASLRTDIQPKDELVAGEYRWFPGGEIRWNVSKEKFMPLIPALNSLTLRVGAGRTSSALTPDGLLQYIFAGNNLIVKRTPSNQTTHLDAGLHLGILQNKLTLDATVYHRRTQHASALLPVLVPGGPGFNTLDLRPDITLLNRGLNLTLSGIWQAGTWQGISTLSAATNRNEAQDITETNNRSDLYFLGLENGQPIGRYLVYEQDGIYPAGAARAGQVRFRDVNNDGQLTNADGRYRGTGLPRYTLNLYQQLGWQKWQLEAQLDGLFGYQILNSTLLTLDAPTGSGNNTVRVLDYWTPTNQNTTVPQPGNSAYSSQLNNQALENGNHLRLSQLSISYEVLKKDSHRASVWVGGQNLLVTGKYRGFDPNVSSAGAAPLYAGRDASVYPVARVWQVGVRGQF